MKKTYKPGTKPYALNTNRYPLLYDELVALINEVSEVSINDIDHETICVLASALEKRPALYNAVLDEDINIPWPDRYAPEAKKIAYQV